MAFLGMALTLGPTVIVRPPLWRDRSSHRTSCRRGIGQGTLALPIEPALMRLLARVVRPQRLGQSASSP